MHELGYVIAMIRHVKPAFDQFSNALGCPQLRSVAVCHGSLGQKANKLGFLFRRQSRRSSRSGFGLEGVLPTGLQCVAPTEHTAGMTAYATGDLMKRYLLLKELDCLAPTFFQHFRRPVRSHGDTPFQDVTIILHYLCVCQ